MVKTNSKLWYILCAFFFVMVLMVVFWQNFIHAQNKKNDVALTQGEVCSFDVENNESNDCFLPVTIAVCPTFYDLALNLDLHKYKIIKTQSTSQSLALLSDNSIDYVIAGRVLKPQEPQFEKIFLSPDYGFSFLAQKEMVIDKNDLSQQNFYTDLELSVVKNALPYLNKIQKVFNVYDYLDKGLLITSWQNTDYRHAQIVHVFDDTQARLKKSRTPILFCNEVCDSSVVADLAKE